MRLGVVKYSLVKSSPGQVTKIGLTCRAFSLVPALAQRRLMAFHAGLSDDSPPAISLEAELTLADLCGQIHPEQGPGIPIATPDENIHRAIWLKVPCLQYGAARLTLVVRRQLKLLAT